MTRKRRIPLFLAALLSLYARNQVHLHQVKRMLRSMELYRQAARAGYATQTPLVAQQSLWLSAVWAGFVLAMEQPALLVIGAVCVIPAIPIGLYWLFGLVVRLFTYVTGSQAWH